MTGVMIIDVADGEAPARIDRACSDLGFFVAVGHGVPASVIESAWNAARAFFDLPLETKMRACHDDIPYGFEPVYAESLERTGSNRDAATTDAKQSLNIGPPYRGPDAGYGAHERRWPTEPYELRVTWLSYYAQMEDLAGQLLSRFATALGAPEDFFDPFTDRHVSALRALDYPPGGSPAVRAGAHTDYGTLTILRPDPHVGGLQIDDSFGGWIEPETPADGLVINVGDLMHRWSNGRWRSARHRVVADPGRRRRSSMAFFHNPNWDAAVEPIVRPGESPRFEPVTAGPWIKSKVDAAHG